MKYKIILALVIIISFKSYPQQYESLLGDSNIWYIVSIPEGYYTEIFLITGDTVIENKHYRLFGDGYIREDTTNMRIYVKYMEKEVIWYDFSLNEGDSILLEYFCHGSSICSLGYFKVNSVSSMKTSLGDRRAIYLAHGAYHPIWIEGIGSLGNFYYRYLTPDIYNFGQLLCFYRDGEFAYKSDLAITSETCMLFSSSEDDIFENQLITVYPNPFDDQLNLKCFLNQDLSIEIFDLFGRKIYQEYITQIEMHQINASDFNQGIYLVRITESNTMKILKTQLILKK